ncbi:DegT/DnrJ/EryC1/StrS family aminotransferase [Tabrizicola sp. BL-A-41-H6]|uniref:DegT/DnrJ/EryC1/StrS family aminotransferase n=1 Tax=Tabrizicola sp. BL-A-41-H6 TaxID=3421107 RepID=UPI003D66E6D0
MDLEQLSNDRGEFIEKLANCAIGASDHFIPLYQLPPYRDRYDWAPASIPVAWHSYLRMISLPMNNMMTENIVNELIAAVGDIVSSNSPILAFIAA